MGDRKEGMGAFISETHRTEYCDAVAGVVSSSTIQRLPQCHSIRWGWVLLMSASVTPLVRLLYKASSLLERFPYLRHPVPRVPMIQRSPEAHIATTTMAAGHKPRLKNWLPWPTPVPQSGRSAAYPKHSMGSDIRSKSHCADLFWIGGHRHIASHLAITLQLFDI